MDAASKAGRINRDVIHSAVRIARRKAIAVL
jgi:hypothetical protein